MEEYDIRVKGGDHHVDPFSESSGHSNSPPLPPSAGHQHYHDQYQEPRVSGQGYYGNGVQEGDGRSYGSAPLSRSPSPTAWACAVCTFENKPTALRCEMCAAWKPEGDSGPTKQMSARDLLAVGTPHQNMVSPSQNGSQFGSVRGSPRNSENGIVEDYSQGTSASPRMEMRHSTGMLPRTPTNSPIDPFQFAPRHSAPYSFSRSKSNVVEVESESETSEDSTTMMRRQFGGVNLPVDSKYRASTGQVYVVPRQVLFNHSKAYYSKHDPQAPQDWHRHTNVFYGAWGGLV